MNEHVVELIAAAICPGTYCEAHSECRDDAQAALDSLLGAGYEVSLAAVRLDVPKETPE